LDLIEVYGMTENAATSHACRRGDVRPGYVGTPLPKVECRIADDGEVLVKSPGQMLGYYRSVEDPQQYFTSDGFFRTGDRGELDEAGRLRITGRVKELFKTSKGKYVAPVPIENRLGSHPFVEAICVTGPGEPQPFALLMLAADKLSQARGDDNTRQQLERELVTLLEQVNATIEDHLRVEYLVVVKEPWTIESGLLTPTLKVRRSQIEDRYLSHAPQWRAAGQRVIWES
jgi:long-subunit acyl-CoA synthetase (AMP-forming)